MQPANQRFRGWWLRGSTTRCGGSELGEGKIFTVHVRGQAGTETDRHTDGRTSGRTLHSGGWRVLGADPSCRGCGTTRCPWRQSQTGIREANKAASSQPIAIVRPHSLRLLSWWRPPSVEVVRVDDLGASRRKVAFPLWQRRPETESSGAGRLRSSGRRLAPSTVAAQLQLLRGRMLPQSTSLLDQPTHKFVQQQQQRKRYAPYVNSKRIYESGRGLFHAEDRLETNLSLHLHQQEQQILVAEVPKALAEVVKRVLAITAKRGTRSFRQSTDGWTSPAAATITSTAVEQWQETCR